MLDRFLYLPLRHPCSHVELAGAAADITGKPIPQSKALTDDLAPDDNGQRRRTSGRTKAMWVHGETPLLEETLLLIWKPGVRISSQGRGGNSRSGGHRRWPAPCS